MQKLTQFKKGHKSWNLGLKGIHLSAKSEFKKGQFAEEKHHLWKGENAGYTAIHQWLRRKFGKPSKCQNCGTIMAKKFEWANISHEYKRDITDWIRLCKPCHVRYDKLTKLSLDDVCYIKRRLEDNEKNTTLARLFNVNQSTISRIKKGLIWK